LGRAVDKAGLTASFRVHGNIARLLTYLRMLATLTKLDTAT